MIDAKALGDQLVGVVREYVARAVGTLAGRLDAIERRVNAAPVPKEGPPGPKGDSGIDGAAGRDGKDADQQVLREAIAAAVAQLPPPTAGRDGIDGKSIDPAEVQALVAKAVEAIPRPANGAPGKDAPAVDVTAIARDVLALVPTPRDGRDGKDAAPVDVESLAADVLRRVPVPVNGKDADPEFIRAEVARAVSAIPKPRDGADGKDGASPHPDSVALLVRSEVERVTAAMPAPRDGAAGRDGADIVPLSAIDPARAYPMGTWAKHAGGLWVARALTDGMTGWDCVVRGIDAIVVTPGQDLRSVQLAIRCSDGLAVQQTMTMPTMIYRGIWREEELYHRGDSATRDGSMWVLMADDQKGKPGDADSGWILSAKRGTNGRDGLRGEKGERGAEGRAGKDLTRLRDDRV